MNGEHWRQTGTTSVVTAVVTSLSLIGYLQINPPRPDPFTGGQATELRRELEEKITDESADLKQEIRDLKVLLNRWDEAHREIMKENAIRLRRLEARGWPE